MANGKWQMAKETQLLCRLGGVVPLDVGGLDPELGDERRFSQIGRRDQNKRRGEPVQIGVHPRKSALAICHLPFAMPLVPPGKFFLRQVLFSSLKVNGSIQY
jgi:hypothetical protein